MARVAGVVLDLRRGPIFFLGLKKYADKAKADAEKAGLKVKLTKVAGGYKLSKVR